MDHSLIKSNQIRHYRIPLFGNPFYSDKDFGIDHNNIFDLFSKKVSAIYSTTHLPTDKEL